MWNICSLCNHQWQLLIINYVNWSFMISFLTSKNEYLMALKYNLASSPQYKKLINWATIPFYYDMHADNRTSKYMWINYIC